MPTANRGAEAWSVGEALLVLGVLLAALALRLHGLDDESLFIDEIRQVGYYSLDTFEAVREAALKQQQPPLDYWFGHVLFKFWSSDFAARVPAALFGTLSLLGFYLAGRCFFSFRLCLLLTLLLALAPFHLYYSQEARPYAIAFFLFTMTIWALLRLVQSGRWLWLNWGWLLVAALLYLYSRALAPLITVLGMIGAVGCSALLSGDHPYRKRMLAGGIALMLAIVGYLPQFADILENGRRFASLSGPMTTLGKGFADFNPVVLWQTVVVQGEPFGVLLFALGAAGLVIAIRRVPANDFPSLLLVILVGVAGLHLFIFVAQTDYPFRPPYAFYLLFVIAWLAGIACQTVLEALRDRRPGVARTGSAIVAVMMTVVVAISTFQFKNSEHRTDWRGAAKYLRENTDSRDLLLFYTPSNIDIWSPSYYGSLRYNQGTASRVGMKRLHDVRDDLARISVSPLLMLFTYRDYFLIPRSRYPVLPAPPGAAVPGFGLDLSKLPKTITTHSYTGLLILEPTTVTGNTLLDIARLTRDVRSAVMDQSAWQPFFEVVDAL